MPAEGRSYRARNLPDLELVHRLLEFRNGVARIEPAQVAALAGRGVLRVDARLVLELRAAVDAVLDPLYLGPGFGFGRDLVDLDEDVLRVRLLDHRRGVAAARVVEFHDVKSAGAAQHGRHIAALHALDGLHEAG